MDNNPLQLLHLTEDRLQNAVDFVGDELTYVSDYMGATCGPANRLRKILEVLIHTQSALSRATQSYVSEAVGDAQKSQEAVHDFVTQAVLHVTKGAK